VPNSPGELLPARAVTVFEEEKGTWFNSTLANRPSTLTSLLRRIKKGERFIHVSVNERLSLIIPDMSSVYSQVGYADGHTRGVRLDQTVVVSVAPGEVAYLRRSWVLSWPQAAAISSPRSARTLLLTPPARSVSRKARIASPDGTA